VSSSDPSRTSSAEQILVRAVDLGVRRSGKWLIKNIDLSVRRGEIVTLIGPNGGGKTTTAKAILGLVRPSQGQVQHAKGLRIGYVPQHLTIDWTFPLSVRRMMSLTAPCRAEDVNEALRQVDIEHLMDAPVQSLSGGEFQRALLARAILRKPDLLILDEPVRSVDFSGEIALYRLIADLRARLGCGVLLISHDLHIVMAETDMVVCLNTHVCCSGTPGVVSATEDYLRLFGPRAAPLLAVYRHDHDHTHGPDGRIVPSATAAERNRQAGNDAG
jgi:zinc transport system ATP-binding protein